MVALDKKPLANAIANTSHLIRKEFLSSVERASHKFAVSETNSTDCF